MLAHEGLHVALQPHRKDDGNDGTSVAHELHRYAKERNAGARLPGCRNHGDERGRDEHAAESARHVLVDLELLGSRDTNEHGHEVEAGITHKVEHLEGAHLPSEHANRHEDGHDGLEHAAAHHGGDHGEEDAGNHVEHRGDALLLLILVLDDLNDAEVPQTLHRDAHVCDRRTDHDLVLPACLHHIDDALGGLELCGLGLGFILEYKAQTRGAVAHGGHVLLAAHELEDGFCQCFVVSHDCLPSVGLASADLLAEASKPQVKGIAAHEARVSNSVARFGLENALRRATLLPKNLF